MKKKILILLLCISSFYSFSETEIYRIKNYIWNIEGKTDSFFLEKEINARKNIEFSDIKSLEKYIEDLKKKCSNLRLFDDFKTELKITPSKILDYNDVTVEIYAKE